MSDRRPATVMLKGSKGKQCKMHENECNGNRNICLISRNIFVTVRLLTQKYDASKFSNSLLSVCRWFL